MMPRRVAALDVALDALAIHRLTRLVTEDEITAPIRGRIVRYAYERAGKLRTQMQAIEHAGMDPRDVESWAEASVLEDPPKLATLVTCRWCTSYWLTLGLVLVVRRMPGWRLVREASALSSAAVLLARVEE